jgi:hypothetical protein
MTLTPDGWDPKTEEEYGRKAADMFGPVFAELKRNLPPGTDCLMAIVAPPVNRGEEGRIIVFSTDRDRMAFRMAEWLYHGDFLRK